MAKKDYFIFSKALEVEPHNQMQFSIILKTLIGGGLTSLQRCSRCRLLLQPTG